jgi:hypothetical protein
MQGAPVADLQDAYLLLIERQLIKTFAPPDRPTVDELKELTQRLKQEQTQSTFGDATRQLTRYFRKQQGLGDGFAGLVEAKTAAALNRLLAGLGTLSPSIVSGGVYRAERAGVGGLRVQVIDKNAGPPAGGVTNEVAKFGIGYYTAIVIERGKCAPDVQVCALSGTPFLGRPRCGLTRRKRSTLSYPPGIATAPPSEPVVLIGALGEHDTEHVAETKESGDRSDITYLANKIESGARGRAPCSGGPVQHTNHRCYRRFGDFCRH